MMSLSFESTETRLLHIWCRSSINGTLRSSLIPRPHGRKSHLLSTAYICTILQGLIHTHTYVLKAAAKLFCTICHSEVLPKHSTAFQRGGMAGRLVFLSTQVLLVSVENGDSLPTHSCHSCVGKVERLERYLKDLRSGLTQRQQVPDNLHAHKAFSNLLPFNGTEVNHMYVYRFYRPFTNILAL